MKKSALVTMLSLLLAVMVLFTGCLPPEQAAPSAQITTVISESQCYSSREEVAAYLHQYGQLPPNYLTKKQALALGWVASEGNLWEVAPGMSIGGDRFGNREGLLPQARGRSYFECDIDYEGGPRNGKRLVYSNDGLIYYTEDHYQSFQLLYGEETP